MPEFIYSMHNVRKKLGDKVVLDNVTLSFYPSAKIGVVGPNGTGKSTLLKVMAGLEIPNNGDATLATAHAYATELAESTGPRAAAATKAQLYDDLLRHDPGASVTDSKRLMNEAMATDEYREGVAARTDGRLPGRKPKGN